MLRPPTRLPRLALPLAAALAGAALFAPADAEAQSKFAVIDSQRAIYETEDGLRVQATLKKLFESRQVELANKERALMSDRDQLEKDAQGQKVSRETLQRKAEGLQKQAAELQAIMVDYQKEMQQKRVDMTGPIVQRVNAIVRRIAGTDGYEMVLEKSAVPYFRGDLELTDRVIQLYNAETAPAAGKGSKGRAPAPAKPPAKSPASSKR